MTATILQDGIAINRKAIQRLMAELRLKELRSNEEKPSVQRSQYAQPS
ncbi:hypothetical protein KQH49_10655 [Mycetohabitans sp. B5]|nr:hypothetical protein [Mycetohabitans sp. B5]